MSKLSDFIHLRVHSAYSLGFSSIKMKDLVALCEHNLMPAIALTDLNNMFGAKDFSALAHKAGVKPLIGMEVAVALPQAVMNLRQPISGGSILRSNALQPCGNVVLLAKSLVGYKNLLKLHKLLYTSELSQVGQVCVRLEDLLAHSEDVVLLTGGNLGFLAQILLREPERDLLNSTLTQLTSAYQNNLFIELNRFGNCYAVNLEYQFLLTAQEHKLPLVATNDCYFKSAQDYRATDVLTCIGSGLQQGMYERFKLSKEQYFTSGHDMKKLFADLPSAIENTHYIAKICNFLVEGSNPKLPSFSEEEDETELLRKNTRAGLARQLQSYWQANPAEAPPGEAERVKAEEEYYSRLEFELSVIIKMNFAGYFLIVADFINWAHNHGIPVGPGRGSGAGSLVAWALGITGINPLRYGLFFERFLNPERVSMPDFDIDLCQRRRAEVINYVVKKYGSNKVAQIITFGSMQARGVLRDVGRALGVPYAEVDKFTKRIPYGSPSTPVTLSSILSEDATLKADVEAHYTLKELYSTALKLENLYKNISTHAAGVVISSDPLEEVVPLYKDNSSDSSMLAVGFSMKHAEAIGLIKFDFLGLKTLTLIKDTVDLINQRHNSSIDINSIPTQNESVIATLLAQGKTLGIFQIESEGMKDVVLQLRPDKIEDIIALISLYRPGPMGNIPSYIERKHGLAPVPSLHPKIDYILEETFGIMVYQEQVMQIAQKLAGYSLGEADILRRAMGKKQPQEMAEQKSKFLEGALHNGVEPSLAEHIFEQMAKFAGYGFNKSHAAAYAFISWQTAYLKAHYPAEFIATAMKHEISDTEKLSSFVEEAKSFNIEVLPPNINYSSVSFVPATLAEGKEVIYYSLLALKGSSANFIDHLERELAGSGPFVSLEDFLKRVDSSVLTKKQLEILIKSGALDSLHGNRSELLLNLTAMLDFNKNASKYKAQSKQVSLFAALGEDLDSSYALKLERAADISQMEKLLQESEVIGFFLSGHPLKEMETNLRAQKVLTYRELVEKRRTRSNLAVVILKSKVAKFRNGGKYLSLSCSDQESNFTLMLTGKSFTEFGSSITEGGMYILGISAKFEEGSNDLRLFVNTLTPLQGKMDLLKEEAINLTGGSTGPLEVPNFESSYGQIKAAEPATFEPSSGSENLAAPGGEVPPTDPVAGSESPEPLMQVLSPSPEYTSAAPTLGSDYALEPPFSSEACETHGMAARLISEASTDATAERVGLQALSPQMEVRSSSTQMAPQMEVRPTSLCPEIESQPEPKFTTSGAEVRIQVLDLTSLRKLAQVLQSSPDGLMRVYLTTYLKGESHTIRLGRDLTLSAVVVKDIAALTGVTVDLKSELQSEPAEQGALYLEGEEALT